MPARTDGTPAVTAGYRQDKDDDGLTEAMRQLLAEIARNPNRSLAECGRVVGISRQRAAQLAKDLEDKGKIRRPEKSGDPIVVVKLRTRKAKP